MTDETTTEQLAEIEGQAEDTPATKYTPPEGWRLVLFGEELLPGDVWVSEDATEQRSNILHWDASAVSGGWCIRRIKPQPEPVPAVQGGLVRDVTHLLEESGVLDLAKTEQRIEELRSEVSYVQRLLGESRQRVTHLEELVASLRTINETQEKAFTAAGKENDALRVQVRILQREADKKNSRIEFLETLNAGNGAAIGDYKAQVEKLQGLVDTARGQLETAATEHDSLSAQLLAVKAELVTQAETSRQLRIELDAAQQVPADSPELRQLRADLAEVTRERDQYRDAFDRVIADLKTRSETAKAAAVEAIAEWLQPFRGCNSPALALLLLEALPAIMRSLTGLEDEEIE